MRKHIVAGNWKMNTSHQEALGLFTEIKQIAIDELQAGVELIVCPPFISLYSLKQINDGPISLGAQNISWEDKGAFTGEISASMAMSVGASHVILGHSERRHYFSETSLLLAGKVDRALEQGLIPIFCVGETLLEREEGRHLRVIHAQLAEGLFHLNSTHFAQVILAYEPVWAIGTGLTASPTQAQEIHIAIREAVSQHYDAAIGQETSILYGGSCNAKNAAELFAQPDIDGGLIGGAALKARDFIEIARALRGAKAVR